MYPPIFGSSALGGSGGGGKDPRKPVNLPSGHSLDVVLKDILGVILSYLERGGWLALRASNRHLRSTVDHFLLAPQHFERVLQPGAQRQDLLNLRGMALHEMDWAYGTEMARIEQLLRDGLQRAARLDGLAQVLAARPQGSQLVIAPPNDAFSNHPHYARAVQESMNVLQGHRARIPTWLVLALMIGVIAILVALMWRLGVF